MELREMMEWFSFDSGNCASVDGIFLAVKEGIDNLFVIFVDSTAENIPSKNLNKVSLRHYFGIFPPNIEILIFISSLFQMFNEHFISSTIKSAKFALVKGI
jgi:hypothetical protein